MAGAGSHPDIYIAAPEDGKKNITVAQIRSLRNEAYVKPHIANGRAFIIDMADTMNEQSQNALLKVLEEPPGNTLFLLIAQSKAALLDTVISRMHGFYRSAYLSLMPPRNILRLFTNFRRSRLKRRFPKQTEISARRLRP